MASLFSSIRSRILLLLGTIFLVVLTVASIRLYERRNSDLEHALASLQEHAELIADKQNNVIHDVQQLLTVLLQTEEIEHYWQGRHCQQFLADFISHDKHIATISVAAPNGDIACTAVSTPHPVNIIDRAHFKNALTTAEPVIGEAIISRTTGKWVLPFAQRIQNKSGKVLGILVVSLDLNWLNEEFQKAGYPLDARLGLVDSKATVLARYPDPEKYIGKRLPDSPFFQTLIAHGGRGVAEELGFDNVRRIYGFAHFAETSEGPLYLWVGLSKYSVTANTEQQFFTTLGILLAMLTISFLAAWYGHERLLIRPLKAIARTAHQLSRGDYQARTGLRYTNDEIGQLARTFDEMSDALRSQNEILRLNRAFKLLSHCNRALVHAATEQQLVADMCRLLVESGNYRMAWVGYAENDEYQSVRPVAQAGFDGDYLKTAKISWADVERGRGPTGTAIRTGTAQINQDFANNPHLAPWREAALKLGYRSSSAFPLAHDAQMLGALTIYSAESHAFSSDEVELLKELAGDIAFGIVMLRARTLHERNTARIEQGMEATIQMLASTLEMRDPYTAGHERRVAELAIAIAKELGLPENDIRGIHLAATIHDIGKIGIPAEILSKPTKLSPLEYQIIQQHPQAGYDILKGIDFPWPIAELVYQHHERLDGSGYPRKLSDKEILPGAKILNVADVVEAMASHRPYRASLGIDPALEEIDRNKGRLYDAAVVDACIRLFRQRGFRLDQATPLQSAGEKTDRME